MDYQCIRIQSIGNVHTSIWLPCYLAVFSAYFCCILPCAFWAIKLFGVLLGFVRFTHSTTKFVRDETYLELVQVNRTRNWWYSIALYRKEMIDGDRFVFLRFRYRITCMWIVVEQIATSDRCHNMSFDRVTTNCIVLIICISVHSNGMQILCV